jgi:hypothetical protein
VISGFHNTYPDRSISRLAPIFAHGPIEGAALCFVFEGQEFSGEEGDIDGAEGSQNIRIEREDSSMCRSSSQLT